MNVKPDFSIVTYHRNIVIKQDKISLKRYLCKFAFFPSSAILKTYAADVVRGRATSPRWGRSWKACSTATARRREALRWHLSVAILARTAHPFHRQVLGWAERVEAMVGAAEAAHA